MAPILIVWFRKILKVLKVRSDLITSQHAAIVETARTNGETFRVQDWTVIVFWMSGKLENKLL